MSTATVRRLLTHLFGGVPNDEAHECMYVTTTSADNCTRSVPPHEGWRRNGLVFCSDEHALYDQEDALI